MASNQSERGWGRSPARFLMWGTAAFVLLLPAVAMQFTNEVAWGPEDFIVMGLMLAAACGTLELAARSSDRWSYRLGAILAVLAALLIIWINLAVGIIGSEDNPANMMFGGVITVAVAGAIMARGYAGGIARGMAAAAVVQVVVGLIGLAGEMGAGGANWPKSLIGPTIFFTGMWVVSALLFRRAARTG